ncbi:MAG: hypothetical protein ACK5QT_02615 [Oligoflexia bacterium]|jgi:hypothetical protein
MIRFQSLSRLAPLLTVPVLSFLLFTACGKRAPIAADQNNPRYFDVTSSETVELPDEELSPALLDLLQGPQDPPPGKGVLDEVEESVDQLVRIGKKIYKIVDDGKPAYNATYNRADVLPKGTLEWQQLTGWKTPVSKRYAWRLKNFYGVEVVTLTYRVLFTPGGTLDAKGNYLQNVTILPENVYVAWGFNMNVKVSMPSITNAGSLERPLAAAELLIDASVTTIMNTLQMTQSYYVRGDGMFKVL